MLYFHYTLLLHLNTRYQIISFPINTNCIKINRINKLKSQTEHIDIVWDIGQQRFIWFSPYLHCRRKRIHSLPPVDILVQFVSRLVNVYYPMLLRIFSILWWFHSTRSPSCRCSYRLKSDNVRDHNNTNFTFYKLVKN